MSVFREIEIEWGGKAYVVTPSNRLLRRIEGQGISIVSVLNRISAQQPPVSEMALIVATFLQSGGCEVTEDEIYASMMTAELDDPQGLAVLAGLIAEAVMPAETPGKNRDGH